MFLSPACLAFFAGQALFERGIMRVLHVATNVDVYPDGEHATGLWLSELVHAWEVFQKKGYEQVLASPAGGVVPLDPRSLGYPTLDNVSKRYWTNPDFKRFLEQSRALADLDAADFDVIYLTGGHGTMFDFTDCAELHRLVRDMFEADKYVASVCHGYCGLLNAKLSDGSYLVSGRRLTGFSWSEEKLSRVAKLVPYNAEALAKERGAKYKRSLLPFATHIEQDGNLVTGQNPESATACAYKVVELITAREHEQAKAARKAAKRK